MLVKEFRDLVQKGLGKAVYYLEDHPDRAGRYVTAIYRESIRHSGYDPQSEGTKAYYLWELIQRSGHVEELQSSILDAMPKLHQYDLEQVYRLACYFAQAGNKRAIQAMKENYRYDPQWNLFVGTDEIIEASGWEGLYFVAEQQGKRMEEDPDYWISDMMFEYPQELLGAEKVMEWFQRESQQNSYIAQCYAAVKEDLTKSHSIQYRSLIYCVEDVKKHLDSTELWIRRRLSRWGASATTDELLQIAYDFEIETDLQKLVNYLAIFQKVAFPLEPSKIIDLAYSEDTILAEEAVSALTNLKDNRLRTIAYQKLQADPTDIYVLDLLRLNFSYQDLAFLEQIIQQPHPEIELHNLYNHVADILAENEEPNSLPILLHLYQSGTCGVCRNRYIEIMIQKNIIPDWLCREALYDSYEDTRKMVQNYIEDTCKR